MKYRIYRIFIRAKAALRVDIQTDNIEQFRKETADTYRVKTGQVKFSYETNEPYEH